MGDHFVAHAPLLCYNHHVTRRTSERMNDPRGVESIYLTGTAFQIFDTISVIRERAVMTWAKQDGVPYRGVLLRVTSRSY